MAPPSFRIFLVSNFVRLALKSQNNLLTDKVVEEVMESVTSVYTEQAGKQKSTRSCISGSPRCEALWNLNGDTRLK